MTTCFGIADDAKKSLVSLRIQNNQLILCYSGIDIELFTNSEPIY